MITNEMVAEAAWELLVEDYRAGAPLDDLAKRHKLTRYALSRELKERKAFVEGRGNRPKLDLCQRGHDMAEHGKQLFTKDGRKNGRECQACKRLRQRAA